MSLFDTLKDTTNGYASALNAGAYEFTKPDECLHCDGFGYIVDSQDIHHDCAHCNCEGVMKAVTEPEPSVSLYNLLDHPSKHLEILFIAANNCELMLRPEKLAMAESYSNIVAWVNILQTAINEVRAKETEAWAEKTAKEINETL